MRIVAYLRVSTDKQAERGNGLDVQRKAIREWAKAHGHQIVSWQADEGVCGANGLESREALPVALAMLRDGKASGIVVKCLDRLARDLVIQETLLAEIRRIGAEPFTASAAEQEFLTDDPSDPSRKLIRQVLGAVNEYERAMIVVRMKAGRATKAAKGGFAYGSPAYGQRAEDKALVPDEAEQAVIARISELRASGASVRKIAAELNAAGLRTKRGKPWQPESVARVIRRLDAR